MAKKPSAPSKPAKAKPAEKKPAAAATPRAPDLDTQQAKAWSVLCRIKVARTNAKTRETELIATRKDLDNQLNALGAGSTAQHLKVSREYVICLRSIKAVRATISTLADRMEHLIEDAMQGKLNDDDLPSDAELFARPSEEDLFHAAGDDDEDDDGQMSLDGEAPAGKKRRRGGTHEPTVPDQPGLEVPEETDQHLTASVEELDLPDHVKAKLFKAGYRVIGALVRIVDDPEQDLMTVLNCDDAQAKAIRKALGEFRTRHRRAMKQAADEAAQAGGLPA